MGEALNILDWIYLALVLAFVLLMLYVGLISYMEKEARAAGYSLLIVLAAAGVLLPLMLLPEPYSSPVEAGLIALSLIAALLLLFPTRYFERRIRYEEPAGQINEKNVMFSRRLLIPGSKRYIDYYGQFPEHEAPDNNFRSKPGLLSDDATFYDAHNFAASREIFEAITAFYPVLDGEPAPQRLALDLKGTKRFIKKWMMKEGAVSVGLTTLKDQHWYSQVGRGPDFGKPAQLPHTHAIAFTVAMDKAMMDAAPYGPTVMESARQYMHAAVIATSVAKYIRSLGYHARAHIDGNYRVVCPLVARDAGLGEIGRMGLLMTPELGPRVRIGVITTDMPLPVDGRKDMSHMIKFCRICKKCADVCPSRAIPFGDRKDIDGVKRWQIDQEKCYTLWCITGTDCGKCMSDCPFSHPDNFFHKAIRILIRNSQLFRHFALRMDDFFYGRRPASKYEK